MTDLGVDSVRSIYQVNNETLGIDWADGVQSKYRLSDLQRQCTCAACQIEKKQVVDDNVRAHRMRSVGSYALKIEFTSGCSAGIYQWDMLRKIGEGVL